MEEENKNKNENKNIIEHLVISGGGQTGFTFYGILKEAAKQGLWNINNIKSIYGVSIGTFIAVILCLKYDWDTIDTYLINRPWQNVFKVDIYTILQAFDQRGIFGIDAMEKMLGPLFAGVDISISITLKEFYELNGIDIYFYTTELNQFKQVKMSHKTHPDWRVIDAVYASCTLPIIFAPLIKDTECFIDGGALCSYPMKSCLDDGNDPNTILGIKKLYATSSLVNEKSSLFDYLMVVLKNTISVLNGNETNLIKHEILLDGDHTTIDNLLSLASSKEEREANIARGITIFNDFIQRQ
uniref:PNPLA domain-containing protein n=1 Tax=viral metagenome TaxID=1070528 RepID=A0A6C0F129_9ZZZZ